ncbi:MAG: NAD(+)/NADH kinase [Deltaproteobacteria bacterium]|nr:NAD(+)/NADH kinase [Deltaproteobacteria bacterium]MBW2072719.1 NAD(+)/NADH kinase [Deltaproteobacteria bacterium]
MNKITIIYKQGQPQAAELGHEMKRWFEQQGTEVCLRENVAHHRQQNASGEKPLEIPPDSKAVVLLGGDGTLLSVARLLADSTIPILGINIGGMGFLTEVSLEDCYRFLRDIVAERFEVEERMRLQASVTRKDEIVPGATVLNDVVINKAALARIVDLEVTIDGRYLTTYRADGLIVATPTGSTAYNLSAGGPIVFPTARAIILTPICSFSLTNRSIILPADACVEIEISRKATDVTLTCDGQVGCELLPGDRITVQRAPHPLRMVKVRQEDYFTVLREKLKWGGR